MTNPTPRTLLAVSLALGLLLASGCAFGPRNTVPGERNLPETPQMWARGCLLGPASIEGTDVAGTWVDEIAATLQPRRDEASVEASEGASIPQGGETPSALELALDRSTPEGAARAALLTELAAMREAPPNRWAIHIDRVIERLEGEPEETWRTWKAVLRGRIQELESPEASRAELAERSECFSLLDDMYEAVSFLADRRSRL